MQLTCEQIQAIMQIISDEDIYLQLEHKKDDDDLEITKVTFFNSNDEKSQAYYIDMNGNEMGEESYA